MRLMDVDPLLVGHRKGKKYYEGMIFMIDSV